MFVAPARPFGGGGIRTGTIGGDILPRGRQNVADFTRRNAAHLFIVFLLFFTWASGGVTKMIKQTVNAFCFATKAQGCGRQLLSARLIDNVTI